MIEVARLRYTAIAIAMLTVIPASSCLASEPDYPELAILQELPVVLSASRLSQPLSETPNAVTVIDRAMIAASGFRTIPELFKLVPGMYVDYQSGSEPLVGYRGATDAFPRRMQVLVDGRSIYMPPFTVVDWGDLPLDINDVEKIEVVRGPAATSYGSNSILGVINIITREAYAVHGTSISLTKGNVGDGNGISDVVARLGKRGERIDYRVTFGQRTDNGLYFPPGFHNVFDGYNDNNMLRFANFRSNYQPGTTDSFDIQFGYSEGVRATGNPEREQSQPRNVLTNSAYQQFTWLRTLGQYDDLQLHYFHQSHSSADDSYTLPIGGIVYPLSDHLRADRHETELQHRYQLNKQNRIVWGAALRYDSTDAAFLFTSRVQVRQSRLFLHDEWRIASPLLLNIGSMLENDGMGNRRLSPRMAVNYHMTETDTLRASISVAHRNPALGEEFGNRSHTLGGILYQDWYSLGALKPERALSREIGYIRSANQGWSINARIYDDHVSDMIWVNAIQVPRNSYDRAWDFRNEATAHYTGLESTFKYTWDTSSLTINYAHQMLSAVAQGETVTPLFLPVLQEYLSNFNKTAPVNSGSLLWSTRLNSGWSCDFGYYQQSSVTVLDGVTPQPLSRRSDLRIAKRFGGDDYSVGGKGAEIAMVVQNVFKDASLGYSGYYFVRRIYLTGTMNF
ncbi:MAG: TonB-dependent receptor [Gallionella sp.]